MDSSQEYEPSAQEKRQADYELCQQVIMGDETAQAEFIARFQGLAKFMVNKLSINPTESQVVDNDDLYQETMAYFLEAARRYNPDVKTKLSAFVTNFLPYKLTKAKDRRHQVRLPDNVSQKIRAVSNENWRRVSLRLPIMDDNETAEFAGVLKHNEHSRGNNDLSINDFRQAQLLTQYMGSIDQGFSPHADTSPGNEYIMDEREALNPLNMGQLDVPETYAETQSTKDFVNQLFERLEEHERFVLRMRFGFDDGQPKMLNEVAEAYAHHYGLPKATKEKIRQIESRALQKLKVANLIRRMKEEAHDSGYAMI